MAVSERRGLGRGSPAEWRPWLLLLLLLGGSSGRIHRLTLTGEKRADIQLNSFGFYTNGSLEVDLSLLRLGCQNTEEKAPLVGFSLTRVRSGSIRSYSNRDSHECPLRKNSSSLLVLFLINTKDLQVQVRKYGEQKKLFISAGLLPESPSEPGLPKSEHMVTPKVDHGTTAAPDKAKLKPTGSQGDRQGVSGKDQELVLGLGHLNNSYNFSFHVVIGSRAEEGQYNLNFHNCDNSVPGREQPFDITVSGGGGQWVHGALAEGQVPHVHQGDRKSVSSGNPSFQAVHGHVCLLPGRRHLLGVHPLQEHVQRLQDPLAHGSPDFHQERLSPLPQYQLLLHQQPGPPHRRPRCHALHHASAEGCPPLHHHRLDRLRLGLRQVRAVGQGEEDLRDSDPTAGALSSSPVRRAPVTTVSGRKSSSWWISSAAAPSSSPWSGEDPHWAPPARGKGRGSADCPLCPSLRPRSIRHLQDASGTDGKVAVNLAKLKLFRHYYVMVICYIYFTRIIAILLRVVVPFQWQWLYQLLVEGSTLAFFVLTGYKFQPARDNPYLQLPQEDEEEMQMEQVMTDSGFREGLSKVNKTASGRELL